MRSFQEPFSFLPYLAAFTVNFINRANGVQVVNARIQTDFVHDSNASFLCTLFLN